MKAAEYTNINCPWCGAGAWADADDHDGWPEGEDIYKTEKECAACGREFVLVCEAEVDYRAQTAEGGGR